VEPLATLVTEVNQLGKDIAAQWLKVQKQKNPNKTPKPMAGDDYLPIVVDLIPNHLTPEHMQVLIDRLDKIQEIVGGIYGSNQLAYTTSVLQLALMAKKSEARKTAQFNALIEGAPLDDLYDDAERTARQLIKSQSEQKEQPQPVNHQDTVKKLTTLSAEISEVTFAYQIETEFKKYKTTLSDYIKKKIPKDTTLYVNLFNTPDYGDKKSDKILQIEAALTGKPHSLSKETETQVQAFVSQHLKVAKAIANYKATSDAEEKLRPTKGPATNSIAERLTQFAASGLDKKLERVGNEAVDRVTSGFIGFCKKIWTKITWHFSSLKKVQDKVKSQARLFSQHVKKFQAKKSKVAPQPAAQDESKANRAKRGR
jgi:hypothetical protein